MRPFHPLADGFGFPLGNTVHNGAFEAARAAAVKSAIASLRNAFGGAVDLHSVPEWAAGLPESDLALSAGAAFLALDFWHAKVPCPSKTADRLTAQASDRLVDCWTRNGAKFVEALAVLRRIPDVWVPTELTERHLVDRLRATGLATSIEVRIRFQFKVPGGNQWMGKLLVRERQRLTEEIAGGSPCPVVLLFRDSAVPMLVLAIEGSTARCYDPVRPGELVPVELSSLPGMLCLDYSPAPPSSMWWNRAASAMALRVVLWRAIRAWRLRHVAREPRQA